MLFLGREPFMTLYNFEQTAVQKNIEEGGAKEESDAQTARRALR